MIKDEYHDAEILNKQVAVLQLQAKRKVLHFSG